MRLSLNTKALAAALENAIATLPPERRCKHERARSIVCMVPTGISEKPIEGWSTAGYAVRWCPDCGALQARHPKRFGLQTRVMWRRPPNGARS